jgi:hypothetical protein
MSINAAWVRDMTDFGLIHDYFERRRPREVTTFSSTADTQGNTVATGMVAWILQDDPGSTACCNQYIATIYSGAAMSSSDYLMIETSSGSGIWSGDGLTMQVNAGNNWEIKSSDGGLWFVNSSTDDCPPQGSSGWSNIGSAADASLQDLVGNCIISEPRVKDPMPLYTKTASGWDHTPLATANQLSNYSARPNAVVRPDDGAMYNDADYPVYSGSGSENTDVGNCRVGDYLGEWIFSQLETVLPLLKNQSVVITGAGVSASSAGYYIGFAESTAPNHSETYAQLQTAASTDWKVGTFASSGQVAYSTLRMQYDNQFKQPPAKKSAELLRRNTRWFVTCPYGVTMDQDVYVYADLPVSPSNPPPEMINLFNAQTDNVLFEQYSKIHSESIVGVARDATWQINYSKNTDKPLNWGTPPNEPQDTRSASESLKGWRAAGDRVVIFRPNE